MGFGHRVYKNYDPRAKIMQRTAHEVLSELGIKDDPLLDVAMELERIALHDDYFIEKKLYPNIDFYSGITLKAMGFPTSMFTVLFAVARTVGWIAQWKEMIDDPAQKIGRPRQLYTGAPQREYSRWAIAEIQDCVRAAIVSRTAAAACALGAFPSSNRITWSSLASAASCVRRSGPSPMSGASAPASAAGVQSCCSNSGIARSPRIRLGSRIVETLTLTKYLSVLSSATTL